MTHVGEDERSEFVGWLEEVDRDELSEWELGFVESMDELVHASYRGVTLAQYEKLREIMEKTTI